MVNRKCECGLGKYSRVESKVARLQDQWEKLHIKNKTDSWLTLLQIEKKSQKNTKKTKQVTAAWL